MQCPRRSEIGLNLSEVFKVPDQDTWRDNRTCSWCGSLDPDEALRLLEGGAKLTPTDKNYKMYVEGSGSATGKAYFQHFSPEQAKKLIELLNAKKITFAEPGRFYELPYFIKR